MDKRTPPFVVCAVAVFGLLAAHAQAQSSSGWINAYRDTAARLIKAATADDFAWQRLAELTDTSGNRLTGSDNLGRPTAWAAGTWETDGLDNASSRTGSARAGAQVGAVGILVRSVGPVGLRTPHTGAVQYQADLPPIPAAAISGEDANRIARLAARGRKVRIRLSLDGHSEAD